MTSGVDDPAARSANRQNPSPERLKVVLVEDDDDNRVMLELLLAREGYEVAVAEDGESGVELAAKIQPALALVDIGLPGIDGYEVARQIRARLGSAVWLIALTGYGQPGDRDAARQAGFDAHVVKPLRPGQLAEILQAFRGDAHAHASA